MRIARENKGDVLNDVYKVAVCSAVTPVVEAVVDSYKCSTTTSYVACGISYIAMRIFIGSRSQDDDENETATSAFNLSFLGSELGSHFVNAFGSHLFTSRTISRIGGACLGSFFSVPFTAVLFLNERIKHLENSRLIFRERQPFFERIYEN